MRAPLMRLFDSFIKGNPPFKAVVKRGARHTNLSSPLGNGESFALMRNQHRISFVVSLLFCGSPSAIKSAVSKVVVDSINGIINTRSISHVGVEGFKVKPFLAHSDSPAPVAVKFWVFWVAATLLHVLPRAPFRGFRHTVGGGGVFNSIPVVAPTGAGFARSQCRRSGKCSATTITDTVPSDNVLVVFWPKASNCKPSKSFSCMVNHIDSFLTIKNAIIA